MVSLGIARIEHQGAAEKLAGTGEVAAPVELDEAEGDIGRGQAVIEGQTAEIATMQGLQAG